MKLALEPTRLLGACQQCNRTTMDYATRGSQVSNMCSDKKNKQFFGAKGAKFLVFFSGAFAGGNGISEMCKVGFGGQTEN